MLLVAIEAVGFYDKSLFNQVPFIGVFLPSLPVFLGIILMSTNLIPIVLSGWEVSSPNEWLLIIDNGVLKNAGVGLACYRWFWQTAVRFPSCLEKVEFQA